MNEIQAKREKFNLLVDIVSKLDITQTQYNKAKERYETIGKWLADGEYCFNDSRKKCFKNGEIYPQGSFRLGTVIKPIAQKEFDVDLVFFIPNIDKNLFKPEEIKNIIGDRLRSHGKYRNMLKELKRGWRINYQDEFHLDITPSIPHDIKGELVPDSKLQDWKASNPREYSDWFDEISNQLPSFLSKKFEEDVIGIEAAAHDIEDFPENSNNKPILKRFIQIMKRHRDIMFKNDDNKPISIIITTLAAHSYNECIYNYYDNELDLFFNVIKNMPKYIKFNREYKVLNPTHKEENFAEKWNEDIHKKEAFDRWHKKLLEDIELLKNIYGIDKIFINLEKIFGNDLVKNIEDNYMSSIHNNRMKGIFTTSFGTFGVKKNTFYGN